MYSVSCLHRAIFSIMFAAWSAGSNVSAYRLTGRMLVVSAYRLTGRMLVECLLLE